MNVRRPRRASLADLSPTPLAVSLLIAIGASLVGGTGKAAPSGAGASPSSSLFQSARPYWVELTVPQRDALQPLAEDWERLDQQTKKKWVEIANRYPRMQPDEQERTRQRMREWARLTPEQRRTARDSFARVRAMNPDQRADMLRKYQELPPEKRQALATEGKANKVIVVPKPMPMPVPVPRRVELSEGAHVRNPAIAAQKGADPIVAPARKAEPPKAAAAAAPVPGPTQPPTDAATATPVTTGPSAPAAAPTAAP